MKLQIVKRRAFSPSEALSDRQIQTLTAKVFRQFMRANIGKSRATIGRRRQKNLGAATELTVVFVLEKEGRALNKNFRRKIYATDVLSFAPSENGSLGELVFCVPVLRRQAREHGLSLRDEFLYLLIHGVLHLLGYDHERSAGSSRSMYRVQDAVFARLREK